MKNIKVTFNDGHIINYTGTTDDSELFGLIAKHHIETGNHAMMCDDTEIDYTIEIK